MKAEEVILRVVSKQLTFWQAASICGSVRSICGVFSAVTSGSVLTGYTTGAGADRVPGGCRWRWWRGCCGCTKRSISISACVIFTKSFARNTGLRTATDWVKQLLQTAGLVKRAPQRGVHRRRRERRPMMGMMLHIDGSTHQWLGGSGTI